MNWQELQQLSPEELEARTQELQAQYYGVWRNISTGKESNVAQLKQMRKDIARTKTALAAKRHEA